MWVIPNGWRIADRRDGLRLVSTSGCITIHEGLAPIADTETLVAGAGGGAIERVECVVTCEGESALLVTLEALSLGFVLLDDTYIRFVGRGSVATTVRELVIATRLYLNGQRRRRFGYRVPRGWTRACRHSDETWLAPEYPARRASLTVLRALPISARAELSPVPDLLGASDALHLPIATRAGLRGLHWRRSIMSDDEVSIEVAVVALSDGAYDYFARTVLPTHEPSMIADLIESFEPVPIPRRIIAPTNALTHWAE